MPEFLSAWLSKESLKHPAVFLLMIMCGGGIAGMVINPFVMAGEFANFQVKSETRFLAIESQICSVRKDIRSESLEGQLRSVESEIWTLEPIVENGNGTERDVSRLGSLKSDKGTLLRQIGGISQDHECLEQ